MLETHIINDNSYTQKRWQILSKQKGNILKEKQLVFIPLHVVGQPELCIAC